LRTPDPGGRPGPTDSAPPPAPLPPLQAPASPPSPAHSALRPSPGSRAATAPALRPPGMPPVGAAKASAHSSTSPPTPRHPRRSPLSASLLPAAARAPGLLHRDGNRLLLRVALATEFADVVADGLPRRPSLKWHGLTPPLAG